jgi:hypothetical protein
VPNTTLITGGVLGTNIGPIGSYDDSQLYGELP